MQAQAQPAGPGPASKEPARQADVGKQEPADLGATRMPAVDRKDEAKAAKAAPTLDPLAVAKQIAAAMDRKDGRGVVLILRDLAPEDRAKVAAAYKDWFKVDLKDSILDANPDGTLRPSKLLRAERRHAAAYLESDTNERHSAFERAFKEYVWRKDCAGILDLYRTLPDDTRKARSEFFGLWLSSGADDALTSRYFDAFRDMFAELPADMRALHINFLGNRMARYPMPHTAAVLNELRSPEERRIFEENFNKNAGKDAEGRQLTLRGLVRDRYPQDAEAFIAALNSKENKPVRIELSEAAKAKAPALPTPPLAQKMGGPIAETPSLAPRADSAKAGPHKAGGVESPQPAATGRPAESAAVAQTATISASDVSAALKNGKVDIEMIKKIAALPVAQRRALSNEFGLDSDLTARSPISGALRGRFGSSDTLRGNYLDLLKALSGTAPTTNSGPLKLDEFQRQIPGAP